MNNQLLVNVGELWRVVRLARVSIAALGVALLAGGCAMESGDEPAGADGIDPATPDEALGSAEEALAEGCGHSICETGPAVPRTCDSCVESICEADPFCCTNSWDAACVGEVSTICGRGPLAATRDTVVSSLKVRVRTGGDDIRGGSQAYGSFQLPGGASLPKTSLNGGANWPNGSLRVATIPISPARPLKDLARFTLEWDGAPRNVFDSYDNWNADQIRFSIEPAGRCPTVLSPILAPGRMTGSRTLFTAPTPFP